MNSILSSAVSIAIVFVALVALSLHLVDILSDWLWRRSTRAFALGDRGFFASLIREEIEILANIIILAAWLITLGLMALIL